jgi:pyrroline-5-carboxylate reductase
MKVGFIGTGNMGGALATAVSKGENVELILANEPVELAEALAEKLGGKVGENLDVVREGEIIFFGVKPDNLEKLAEELKDVLKARTDKFFIVSMLAGKTLDQLEEALGDKYPIIRILPNVPVMVGEGLIMYTPNDAITDTQLETFLKIMSNAGLCSRQEESLIAAGAGVAGCGPAFAAMFIESLADGGVACGLPRHQAIEYAAQMAKGTAQYILEKGIHPDVLKDTVTSPGGTTIQGVRTLEKNGFRSALFEAVISTVEKDKLL